MSKVIMCGVKVFVKKAIGTSERINATMPDFRTRDQARKLASKMREAGVVPTTPAKSGDRWNVKTKHDSVLSLAH